jgi:hypothetical protein
VAARAREYFIVSSVNERIEYNQERRQWIADTSKTDGGLDGDEVDGWRKVEGGRASWLGKVPTASRSSVPSR